MQRDSGFSRGDMDDESSLVALKKIGLDPKLDLREYRRRVEVGMAKAALEFAPRRLLSELSLDKIKELHRMIFGEVHNWAGEFRKPTEGVKIGKYHGADSARIESELLVTIKQVNWILGRQLEDTYLREDLAPAAAIAHCHVRLERIHPFRDGNGRSGRLILTSQVKEAFNSDLVLLDRRAYLAALRSADEGELRPLVNLIRNGATPTTQDIRDPFRIPPLDSKDLVSSADIDTQFQYSFLN